MADLLSVASDMALGGGTGIAGTIGTIWAFLRGEHKVLKETQAAHALRLEALEKRADDAENDSEMHEANCESRRKEMLAALEKRFEKVNEGCNMCRDKVDIRCTKLENRQAELDKDVLKAINELRLEIASLGTQIVRVETANKTAEDIAARIASAVAAVGASR